MKKLIIPFLAIFALGANAQSIKFGLKAGLNVSSLSGTSAAMSSAYGVHAGGLVEFKILDKFAIQPEVLFSTQGAKSEETTNFGTGIENQTSNIHLAYINIPLMAKYFVVQGLFVELGPQCSFLIDAKNKKETITTIGTSVATISETENIKKTLKDFDISANVGVGYDILNKVIVQARYSIGLSNINDTYSANSNIKNGVLQVSVGYKF